MEVAIAGSAKVVTTASVARAYAVQPENREWTTAIDIVSGDGWRCSLMLILAGRVHIDLWYRENPHISRDWAIELSDNGWTNDEIAVKWIKHFDKHTKHRIKGQFRLLVLDGHGSHVISENSLILISQRLFP